MSLTLRTYKECQYWLVEPSRCEFWNNSTSMCEYFTYGGLTLTDAEGCHPEILFPFCNLLGTAKGKCSGYKSTGEDRTICILPDPSRHVVNKATGNKWVTSAENDITYDDAGLPVPPGDWTFNAITGYNQGNCDSVGQGTKATCTGYSPQKIGFSAIASNSEEAIISDKPGLFQFDYQLPLDYTLLNIRAKITPCYWWNGDVHQYSLDAATGTVTEVEAPTIYDDPDPTKIPVTNADGSVSYYQAIPLALKAFDSGCIFNPESEVEPFKSGGKDEFQYKCNGCSTSCPHYTGPCWTYCTDNKILPGFNVLAEQILELRWMARKNNWTAEVFEKIFDDPYIWAWRGWGDDKGFTINPVTSGIDYDLPVDKVFINNYDTFGIDYLFDTITPGTASKNGPPSYPNLIRDLKPLTSGPVIRNRFENLPGDDATPYYEFTNLVGDPEVYIYGDVPNRSETYVINLEDEIFKSKLPREIYEYNNNFDLIYAMTSRQYNSFVVNLESAMAGLLYTEPHKMRKSLTGQDNYTFLVNINAKYGNNRIAAFNKEDDVWQFSILEFDAFFVGGMVRQTNYSLEGGASPIVYSPNYERGTGASINDNGVINVTVDPIIHRNFEPEVSYVYNDFDYQKIKQYQPWDADQGEEHLTGYLLFEKIISTITVDFNNIIHLNSCHLVLTIDNDSLTSAIFAWLPDSIEITYASDGFVCELVLIAHNDSHLLAPNQVIVFPKNISEFRSFCQNDSLTLTNVSTFHKRSFNDYEPPEADQGETVRAISLYADPGYVENPDISEDGYDYTLRKFDGNIHFGAVLKNRSGREFSTIKTNLLYWVKQPYCPDVEIKYEWLADYKLYQTNPTCRCVGEFTETLLHSDIRDSWFSMPPGVSIPYSEIREPYCGDHDRVEKYRGDLGSYLGANNKIGAMWYPYLQCDGYQSYAIITNQGYSAMEIMSDFVEADGDQYVHGQHDIRMLGPDQNLGWEGDYCVMPSMCTCGRAHFNGRKKGAADYTRFNGWAQYRSGVSQAQLSGWYLNNIGIAMEGVRNNYFFPGFGNSSRPFLRSFRSNHRGEYYYKNTYGPGSSETPGRLWKYMPAHADFTFADFSSSESKMFEDYSNHLGGPSTNTLGMVLFDNLEGEGYYEELDTAQTYGYNEVFRNHSGEAVDQILYPEPSTAYSRPSMPWLDFQDNIQWAWRLPWKAIERHINTSSNQGYIFMSCLSLQYPPYKYNYTLKEQRACPPEGVHIISFYPPRLNIDGSYEPVELTSMSFYIDDGPRHYFDFINGWNHEAHLGVDFDVYENIATDEDYYTDITLAIPARAPEDYPYEVFADKEIIQEEIVETTYYGYPGLAATLHADFFHTLPQIVARLIPPGLVELGGPGEDYTYYEVSFNEDGHGKAYKFDFTGDYLQRIKRFVLTCRFGVLPDQPFILTEDEEEKEIELDVYYHIPGIIVYAPVEGGWVEIGSLPMRLATSEDKVSTATITLDMGLPAEYMWYGGSSLVVVFRGTPTENELSLSGYTEDTYAGMDTSTNSYINYITLDDFELWQSWLIEGSEQINTYERKFRVSRAGAAEEQPQGTGEERLLMAPKNEISTVYQQDDRVGMKVANVIDKYNEWLPPTSLDDSDGTKLYRSKIRSRHIHDIVLEQTPITANTVSDIHQAEALVPDMYNNKALGDEPTNISARHFILPEIEEIMNEQGFNFKSYGDMTLTMTNTFPAKLAELVPQLTYCPAGHLYLPSPYFDTYCRPHNQSFGYIYAQVEANSDVTELHNMIYAGVDDPGDLPEDGGYYTTDTAVVGLGPGHTARGFGEVYIAEEDQDVPGYHKVVNEVSKYAQGSNLYQSRREEASFIYHGVYPRVFSRFTKFGAFSDDLAIEISWPPGMGDTPLLDFTGGQVHPDANTARTNFWLAGGVNWKSKHGSSSYT